MKIEAKTREEYMSRVGEREPIIRELDALIREHAPDVPPVMLDDAEGMYGNMLAYGMMPYKNKTGSRYGEWPLIMLGAQKNYVSLYVCAVDEDGKYVAEKHADQLGKVSVGKSCIRFKKLEDLDQTVVVKILKDLNERFKAGEKLFGL